jgi:TolB protein
MRARRYAMLPHPSGAGLLTAVLVVAAALVVSSGAVEVFIDATRGSIQKIPIAVFPFKEGLSMNGQVPLEVLKADLRRSLLFDVADLEKLGIKGEVNAEPPKEARRKVGEAGWAVQVWGSILPRGRDAVMEGTLYDFTRDEKVGGKRYVGSPDVVRQMAHRFADELVFHFTGEQGIARSRIAFVSEKDGNKELFVMDYDGYNPRQVTFDASLNLAPSWSPDKQRLAFVTYREGKDPQIHELDLTTGRRRAIVALPGLNITPEWAPSGDELAFATSKDGNSEIYKVDKAGRRFERLTDHWAADLAPTWSPTGREIAFTSDRGGTPQIYLMSADGANLRPLTYRDRHGSYNTAAAWSPKGNWIAYVCRDERRFLKICLISPDGQQVQRLTSGASNDESPSWSADGRHVAFSSTRHGRRDIYIVNVDATGLERLTANGSFNDDPAWSLP